MRDRRIFFQRAAAFIGALGLWRFARANELRKPGAFMHVVYFWLKSPDDRDERRQFLDNVKTFTRQVKQIRSLHIGVPADTDRPVIDRTYTFSLVVSFKNKADHDAYQEHPAHVKFVEDTQHLWIKVLVYDSEEV
jgi:hypothetical protein